jgi:hypothetical protein
MTSFSNHRHVAEVSNYKNKPLEGDRIETESGAINMKNVTRVEHVAKLGRRGETYARF